MPGSSDNRTLDQADNFAEVVGIFSGLIQITIPAILAAVLLFIVWKVIDTWVINAGDEQKVTEGKQIIFVSIIVMVVISSVWGIVALLQNSLFL